MGIDRSLGYLSIYILSKVKCSALQGNTHPYIVVGVSCENHYTVGVLVLHILVGGGGGV